MKLEILKSKIHRATVTDANLDYVGSLSLDPILMKAGNLNEYEKILQISIIKSAGDIFQELNTVTKHGGYTDSELRHDLNIKNAKSLSVLFDVPLTTALQPFLSSDSLIKNISFYDVEHNCRKNCRKKN